MSDQHYNSLDIPLLKPSEKVKLLVGTLTSRAYILPRNTLCFYSPWLRTFIKSSPLPHDGTIVLRYFEPAEFDVFVAWMNYETDSLASYHQRGAELIQYIQVQDTEGVHLAWKVWSLANRMGGACVSLRDECMKFLYKEYMETAPRGRFLYITPGVAMYVFSQDDVDDLRHFVLNCLARDGMLKGHAVGPLIAWESVLLKLPWLARFMANGCKSAREKGYVEVKSLDWYLSKLGKITPNGVKQKVPWSDKLVA
ncbi:hypothetical protein BDU57DRAFT_97796 [Ampelomyces quisqualis]|uniref:Uncharacterized protein n=1 Tax=Ampelomyces quisqualis TaxID=50730 RepID=A0A6A5Q5R2_AMPQU|nr:hypothetical protein BDU57DRAFT_97796 [Ampelomyces quisqualis]